MSVPASRAGPMRVGVAISDTSAGMFLGQGILLALLHRERTGEGQWVHTSLLEAMMCKLDFQGARYTMTGDMPDQQGNDHPTQVPMGTFEAKDGHVNIAAFGEVMWKRFCDALGADELYDHPDYQSVRDRIKRRHAIKEDMNAVTRDSRGGTGASCSMKPACHVDRSTTSAKASKTSR